jgi:hypothetical protein
MTDQVKTILDVCADVARLIATTLADRPWATMRISALRDMIWEGMGDGAWTLVLAPTTSDMILRGVFTMLENTLARTWEVSVYPRPSRLQVMGGDVRFYRHDSEFSDLVTLVEQPYPLSDKALSELLTYARDGSWRSLVPNGGMRGGERRIPMTDEPNGESPTQRTPHDDLADLIKAEYTARPAGRRPAPRMLAAAILRAGWRPPTPVAETTQTTPVDRAVGKHIPGRNWHPEELGAASIAGRYGCDDILIEPSTNEEVCVTDGATAWFANVHDLTEALAYVAESVVPHAPITAGGDD